MYFHILQAEPDAFDVPVKLVDSRKRILHTSFQLVHFDGTESFTETLAKVKAAFPEVVINGIKIGKLSGEDATTDFGGVALRKWMRTRRLRPSQTTFYTLVAADDDSKGNVVPKKPRLTKSSNLPEPDSEDLDSEEEPEEAKSVVMIAPSEVEQMEKIGKGAQATVYKGRWNGTFVALKETELPTVGITDLVAKTFNREISMHADLRHPNVLSFYGVCRQPTALVMVIELMDTSLEKVIRGTDPVDLTRDERLFICCEVTKGVIYLHCRKVVHSDLKPGNVLLSNDLRTVKLCDMGLSRVKETVRATGTMSPKTGTYLYMSPEIVLNNTRSTFSCDVWALGATFAELFTLMDFWKMPKRLDQLLSSIKKRMNKEEVPHAVKALEDNDQDMYNVVSPCLAYDAAQRPSAVDILQHLEQIQK